MNTAKSMSERVKAVMERIKSVRLLDAIYPTTLAIVLIATATLFVLSSSSMSRTLNAALADGTPQKNTLLIDENALGTVAGKLGIAFATTTPAQPPAAIPVATSTEPQSQAVATSTSPTKAEKAMLKIAVLNATKITGLAADMKASLVAQGYVVHTLGNTSTSTKETVLELKASAERFKSDIVVIISAKYPAPLVETLPESSVDDAVISVYR